MPCPRREHPPSRSKSAASGSRHRRPLPDRPPALQAFRSVLSETTSVSTQRLSRLPFLPPSPRSSIPESTDMIPYQRVIRQSARSEFWILDFSSFAFLAAKSDLRRMWQRPSPAACPARQSDSSLTVDTFAGIHASLKRCRHQSFSPLSRR